MITNVGDKIFFQGPLNHLCQHKPISSCSTHSRGINSSYSPPEKSFSNHSGLVNSIKLDGKQGNKEGIPKAGQQGRSPSGLEWYTLVIHISSAGKSANVGYKFRQLSTHAKSLCAHVILPTIALIFLENTLCEYNAATFKVKGEMPINPSHNIHIVLFYYGPHLNMYIIDTLLAVMILKPFGPLLYFICITNIFPCFYTVLISIILMAAL